MSLRRKTLSLLFRSLAVLALVTFSAAQTLCFIHCNFGDGPGHSGAPLSCHGSAKVKSCHNGQETPAPAPSTTCLTFKTILAGGDPPILTTPHLPTPFLIDPVVLSLDAAERQADVSFSRRVRRADLAFTPVVCLGPALRSLAPPSGS